MSVVAVGCWAPAGPPPPIETRSPTLFVEARPRLTTDELFGLLREAGVDVWFAADMRLRVRIHDAETFARSCELLATLGHDLEALDLAYLPLDDLSPLIRLRATERLDLTGTRADLRPLRHLGGLRALGLAHTDLDSLAPLAELTALEQLDLSDARVDLRVVGHLSDLRTLNLSAARTAPAGFEIRAGEGLELWPLHGSPRLEQLDLSRTKVSDWSSLSSLWALRGLDLSYTNFAELWLLVGLDELESLGLRRTAVSDLTPLYKLDGLRAVDLRDCELVDDAEVDRLMSARPGLRVLW